MPRELGPRASPARARRFQVPYPPRDSAAAVLWFVVISSRLLRSADSKCWSLSVTDDTGLCQVSQWIILYFALGGNPTSLCYPE